VYERRRTQGKMFIYSRDTVIIVSLVALADVVRWQ
jgi:hypothetical protein